MPAHVHTQLPEGEGHYGELLFAEQAIAAADSKTHFWFGLSVPGGNEIDALVLHEDIGAFVIEIKAVGITAIEAYDLETCQIKGRKQDRHPVKQAHWAMTKLRIFLEDIGVQRPPFFFTTAAFPRIDRDAMTAPFGSDDPESLWGRRLQRHFDALLFSDDLKPGQFVDRLKAVRSAPPSGPSPVNAAPRARQVAELIEATTGRASSGGGLSDQARADVLTSKTKSGRASVERYLQPAQRSPVVLTGYPGTGKTLYLLEIAIAHAEAGRQVLFTCYNKVLGASLRSSLTSRAVPKSVADRVLVADVFALRKELNDNGLLDALKHSFGTICVDEAQDMGDPHFEFLQLLAAPGAEWFIADGEGQELYDPTSAFLKDAREHGTKQRLNRRFRVNGHVEVPAGGQLKVPTLRSGFSWS